MCVCECVYLVHRPNQYSVRQWTGGPELYPRSGHTKDSKNGI